MEKTPALVIPPIAGIVASRKRMHFRFAMALAMVATLALAQLAGAAVDTFTNTVGGNWSVSANWTAGAPGTTSDVIFSNAVAGEITTNDIASEHIDSLTYGQTTATTQTTVIPAGQTLTIASGVAAGSPELYCGSATQVNVILTGLIQGPSSTITMTGLGDIWSAQGNTSANGPQDAILDLHGLGTLNATIGRMLVGVNVNGINRMAGELLLAQTNNLTFTGASPQVEVGEATANGNSGSGSANTVLSFGQVNNLFADTMRLGGDKCSVAINFAAAQNSAPTLKVRNADGVSPCTVIDFGYAAGDGGTGTTETFAADFSAGSVDILATTVHLPQGQPGQNGSSESGSATGTLTLGAGTFAVGTFEIGYGNSASTSSTGATTGTLNINNNGLFSAGATVNVSTVLDLAHTNGCLLTTISGTVNVNTGGTLNANTITSGGGVSTLNVASGTLTITNIAGTLAKPIGFFSIGASTLNIPLSFSGSTIVTTNFTTTGPTTVNISSVPGIATYPVTFTIIQYSGIENGSGSGTFTLGSLPAGSPSYAGTILDTGNGVVQVKLSTGPTAILATTWTGATDNNWDYTTPNWLYQSVAADFVDGRSTLFNDTPTQTNVLLDGTPLAPSSIVVSNNTRQYTFGGTGFLNAGTLTKSGTSSLTLDNSGGNNNIPTVVINGGTLQIGAGDANGGIAAVNITNNGALVVDLTTNLTLSSDISGTGTLTQAGSGTLVLSGANSYNGATLVTNGTLEIDQTTSGTSPVTTYAGTILSGFGVVGGPVTVGGELSPGSTALNGNFQAEDGLTLSNGAILNFGLSPSDNSITDGANDSVAVTGDLTVHNNTINVNIAGAPPQGAQYTLFTYTGILSGSFNPLVTGTHFTTAVDSTSTLGFVYLNVTGSSGYNLKWNSTASSAWDTVSTNWLNLANSTASTFASGDTVLLDDTAAVQPSIIINSTVYPDVVTNSANANEFTISGTGGIGGSASLVQTGTASWIMDTANSFTGSVNVQAGTFVTLNPQALGNTSGITVQSGATLDIDGQDLGPVSITASGSGVNGNGAVVNSGGAQAQAFRQLTLAGDTSIGGSGNVEMNNSGGAATLSTGGNAYNLTKVGTSVWNFQNLTTFDTALANIDIQAGTLLFNGFTPDMGATNDMLTIENGASLAFGGNQLTFTKVFVVNGDGATQSINNEGGANDILAGPVTLNGECVINVGGTQLGISGNIGGGGGLIKTGASPLILSGTNSYTGDTQINGGTLQLTNGATLTSSSSITIAAGATLDMQGTVLTLPSGQSLNGDGSVINGSLVAGVGSSVVPGLAGAVGTLTVDGAVTLSGTTTIELDPADSTNSMLSSGSTIHYGGTLSLPNLSALSAGNSFKIFSGSSYSGSFASISPATPGAGLTWDTSALATSGTIKVKGAAAGPRITSISVSGTTLNITATNGAGSFVLLGSTNLTLPLHLWTPILTNSFNGGGTLNLTTNIVNPAVRQQFYIISQ